MTYDSARDELRAAELALMQQRETVAELRRKLPPGPATPDYEFQAPSGPVRLSELLADVPTRFSSSEHGGEYRPRNFSNDFLGPVAARFAGGNFSVYLGRSSTRNGSCTANQPRRFCWRRSSPSR